MASCSAECLRRALSLLDCAITWIQPSCNPASTAATSNLGVCQAVTALHSLDVIIAELTKDLEHHAQGKVGEDGGLRKLKEKCSEIGLKSASFVVVPKNYYDLELEQRRLTIALHVQLIFLLGPSFLPLLFITYVNHSFW